MALFYDDRDYGRNWNRGNDRGYRGDAGWGEPDREPTMGRDRGGAAWGGYDRGPLMGRDRGPMAWGGYDPEDMTGRGRYDRGYKSRWQTDYGDPFGDRTGHTPMRMVRGEYRGPAQRGGGWGSTYDRDFSSSPMGYDPYFDQSRRMSSGGGWNRYDRAYRGHGRGMGYGYGQGYDVGWF